MTEISVVETLIFVINIIGGFAFWLMKSSYSELKEDVKLQRAELERVKDTYFKKEDFREFKEELWTRLDRMELHWSERLNKIKED